MLETKNTSYRYKLISLIKVVEFSIFTLYVIFSIDHNITCSFLPFLFLILYFIKTLFSGIWADSDSDREDQRPSLGWAQKKKKDFAAPISFISGGFKQSEKSIKAKNDGDSNEVSS